MCLALLVSLMLYLDGSRSPRASPQYTAGILGKFPLVLWWTIGNLLVNPLSKTSSVTLFRSLFLQWHNYGHFISHLSALHSHAFVSVWHSEWRVLDFGCLGHRLKCTNLEDVHCDCSHWYLFFWGVSDKQISELPLLSTCSLAQSFEIIVHPWIHISTLAVKLCISSEFF